MTPFIAVILAAIFGAGILYTFYAFIAPAFNTPLVTVPVVGQDQFTSVNPPFSPVDDGVDKNCGDFFDQDDVQKYYIAQGGPTLDPDELDLDNDGVACENFVFSTLTERPLPTSEAE